MAVMREIVALVGVDRRVSDTGYIVIVMSLCYYTMTYPVNLKKVAC